MARPMACCLPVQALRLWDGCALRERRAVGHRQFGPVTHAQPGAGRGRVGGCVPTTRGQAHMERSG